MSEQLLRDVLDAAPDTMLLVSADGTILFVNGQAEQLFGYSRDELIGQTIEMLVPAAARDAHVERRRQYLTSPPIRSMGSGLELRGRRSDGSEFPADVSLSPFEAPGWRGVIASVRDATAHQQAEAALRSQRDHYAALVAALEDGLVECDRGGHFVDVNDCFCEMVGLTREEVLATRYPYPWLLPEHVEDPTAACNRWRCTGERRTEFETVFRRSDGKRVPVWVTQSAVQGPDGGVTGAVGLFRDITARKQIEEHLAHLALHDPLTELPNRRLLVDELVAALARARRGATRVAVLFIDLDGFKAINDTYGHDAGDRLLIEAAHRLRRAARGGDTVARISGDEFVVVCENVRDRAEADAARLRLHRELADPVSLGDGRGEVRVRASIGVAVSENGTTEPEQLLRDADAAMYRIKRRGHVHVDLVDEERHDREERGSLPTG